jgi:hypothetical protein
MKKIIFALLLLPLFSFAQDFNDDTVEGVYQSQPEQQQIFTDSDMETMGRGHKVRCGEKSDYKCQGKYVYETCERDASHGIYGSCRSASFSEDVCRCF